MRSVRAALRKARRPALLASGENGAARRHLGVDLFELRAERRANQLQELAVSLVDQPGVDVLGDLAGNVGLGR